MRKLFVISALLIGAMSCKNKDSDFNLPAAKLSECEEIDCQDLGIPLTGCEFSMHYVTESPVYELPCFNPKSNDEFIYRQGNKLWKFDLRSRNSTLVKDSIRPFTQPTCSNSGYLSFTLSDLNVWVMRDDGAEMKRISNSTRDLGAEFHPLRDEVIYSSRPDYSNSELENNPELWNEYIMKVVDISGNVLDSFCRSQGANGYCNPWELCAWSPDGMRYAAPDRGVSTYDLDGNETERLYTSENTDGLSSIIDLEWHPDNQRLFVTDNLAMREVNTTTGQIKIIKHHCESQLYLSISISPDGETLIAQKSVSTYADCVITTKTGIVRMNIDGSEEEELLMP